MKFACENTDCADRALLGLPECLFNLLLSNNLLRILSLCCGIPMQSNHKTFIYMRFLIWEYQRQSLNFFNNPRKASGL